MQAEAFSLSASCCPSLPQQCLDSPGWDRAQKRPCVAILRPKDGSQRFGGAADHEELWRRGSAGCQNLPAATTHRAAGSMAAGCAAPFSRQCQHAHEILPEVSLPWALRRRKGVRHPTGQIHPFEAEQRVCPEGCGSPQSQPVTGVRSCGPLGQGHGRKSQGVEWADGGGCRPVAGGPAGKSLTDCANKLPTVTESRKDCACVQANHNSCSLRPSLGRSRSCTLTTYRLRRSRRSSFDSTGCETGGRGGCHNRSPNIYPRSPPLGPLAFSLPSSTVQNSPPTSP